MGKNKIIKTIANFIGNITAHKILSKYGNKPEAIHHVESEVIAYGNSALDIATEFNWNQYDKQKIKEESFKSFKKELQKSHFNDVKFPMKEAVRFLNQTLEEIGFG